MTIWILGLCVCVLFLGGLGVDLWRVIEVRRSLATTARSVAAAGASALDETALRRGATILDPARAERRAAAQLDLLADAERVSGATIEADETQVAVELEGELDFSLLDIFTRGDPVTVSASATASPVRID